MTHERWIAVLVAIATVLLTLIFLAVMERAGSEAVVKNYCVDPSEREHLRGLALQGIDDGFRDQIAHLFEVWMKEPSVEQPRRAQVGTNNAVSAHIRARKLTLAWDPPNC